MSKNLFKKVKELNLPLGGFALFGSSPICVRGLRDCRDVDIIVTKDLWDECRLNKEWETKEKPGIGQYLEKDEIELWKNWVPGTWDLEKLIREAEIIDGLPFVRLETVVVWKKLRGQEKDLKDVEIIEKFLKD